MTNESGVKAQSLRELFDSSDQKSIFRQSHFCKRLSLQEFDIPTLR
jgi:hypothetical protein